MGGTFRRNFCFLFPILWGGAGKLKLGVILNLVILFVYFHIQTTTKIVVKTVGTMIQC